MLRVASLVGGNMKVKIEHDMLDSKIATAAALFNEWIKWCTDNNLKPRVVAAIPRLFEVSQEEYDKDHDETR